MQSISKLPDRDKLSIQFRQLQKAVADIQDREDKLEKAILTNPSKALEIPLIQRDLENIKVTQQANILSSKESIDRIYDLAKWLLGGIAVSIFTQAVVNFLKEK